MKRNYYSRKLRQFKNASKQLNILLANKSSNQTKVKNLAHKVNVLLKDLRAIFSATFIKKSLAGASFVLGLFFANNANAQSYSPAVQNPFGFQQLDSLSYLAGASIVDIDADGDYDMITGGDAFDGNVFNFIENTGTAANAVFTAAVEYPFGLDTIPALFSFPTTVDIDADGDFDLMTGITTFPNNEFGLFFNINSGTATNPNFSTPYQNNPFGIIIDPAAGYSVSPAFSDIDNDGDQDLFITDYYGDVRYYENTGTASSPAFAAAVLNPFGLTGTGNYVNTITLSDFDGDGDKDVLVGNGYYGSFNYFENTGTPGVPTFAAVATNPFGLDQVSGGAAFNTMVSNPADMDGDGDKDIVTGFYNYNFSYYENTSGIGAGIEESLPNFNTTVYPSPANDIISITFSGNKDAVSKIEVLDISGKVVLSTSQLISELNIKHLEAGMYTVKISDKTGKATQTKIQKI
jgi:hypothetical protein